ncbi:DUF1273 domain-containing protein [Bacillus massiliglaciei]|uniref:DUF1273 domain-containing protein n=1 Tax=Bacillus massiliglaciei TaxID=1816693 RepID=UPI000AF8B5E5|nr:DUF1273 domain-containing protein [Bacillus massiliglaciei]
MKVLYVTGYKAFEFGIFKNDHEAVPFIKKAIRGRLETLVEDGLEWVIISGQLGTELWAAEVILEMKEENEQLHLGIITPYLNQEEGWNETNQDFYRTLISQADYTDAIYKKNYEGPYQLKAKNQFMVQKSDGMLIVYDTEREGSPKFALSEAQKRKEKDGYPIFSITFDDLQQAAEEDRWAE